MGFSFSFSFSYEFVCNVTCNFLFAQCIQQSLFCPRNSSLSSVFELSVFAMGGDGGTSATQRDFIVTVKKAPKQADQNEVQRAKWCMCALSALPLSNPIVCDELGNLFNKDALIEVLLSKKLPKNLKHIKNLKDVFPVHLTQNPEYHDGDSSCSRWICPISFTEAGKGGKKFAAIRTCGHVFEHSTLNQIATADPCCVTCNCKYTKEDIVIINGSKEDVALMKQHMKARKLRAREARKQKQSQKNSNTSKLLSASSGGRPRTNESVKKRSRPSDNHRKIKKPKSDAVDIAIPVNADPQVFQSLFRSGCEKDQETFLCRSTHIARN